MTIQTATRSWRMTTLACVIASGTFAQAVQAEDSAQGFIVQEQARLAAAKAENEGADDKAGKVAGKAEKTDRTAAQKKAARKTAHPAAHAPESLQAIVRREAEANGVPVQVAMAVVTIESRWNPGVTGSAGEVGLMQIKYPTARMIGYTGTRKALYEPATNIRWGMKYLGGAHQLAGGDLCRTVSKYQGGHAVKGITRMGAVYCGKARSIIASLPTENPRLALNERNEPRG